ncbi:MAG: serine hydrolase, partial [Acidimicrobiia bacterium]
MRKLLVLFVVCMVAAACNGEQAAPTTTAAPSTTPGPATTADPADSTVAPTTASTPSALDERLAWLTGLLGGGELSESDYEAAFTADFLANVSHADFQAVIGQVSDLGDSWSVGEFEEREDLAATVLLVPSGGTNVLRADISLEPNPPYRISGLLLQPAEPPTLDDPPADFDAAADRLAQFGTTNLLVAEVTDGTCEPVFEAGSGGASPVGSAAKLYVLGAVVDAVEAGTLAWDDPVTITDELKSVPSGVMQDEEEGATFSLREMAEVMIALSDNTATDHLIDLVGRQQVEAAQEAYGMDDPSANIPFLNTLELTALKVGPASGLATQWLDADEAGRRAILEQISDITPADIPIGEFVDPVLPDRIEWFATPADMCRVLVSLY